jgi:ribonuclease BN (tRNA processing enzyme)
MRVWVLGTGSSGNLLLVDVQGTRIFLDAGIGPKRASMRMRDLGADLFPRGADGIVVTHEHNDHCAQLEALAKALQFPKIDFGEPRVYLHDGVKAERVRNRFETRSFKVGAQVSICRSGTSRTLAVLRPDSPHFWADATPCCSKPITTNACLQRVRTRKNSSAASWATLGICRTNKPEICSQTSPDMGVHAFCCVISPK